jgi:hypothetical protein
MRKLLVVLAATLALAGCNPFAAGSPNALKFQAAMESICSFRPSLDTAIAILKSFDAEVGATADIINSLASKACAVVTAHKGDDKDWVIVAPDGKVVPIEGQFVTPDAPPPGQ